MKTNQKQPNDLPKWHVRKLASMFTVRRGGSPRPIEAYITDREDGLNWLKIGDIEVGAKYITKTSSKILKEGLSRTTLVKKGDFILSNSMSFGRPYIMDIESCIHDGWLTFQGIKTDILDRDFLYYLLSGSKTQAMFVSISAGSGVQNLKKETVSEVSLPIPPLLEQNRIVSVLETWDRAIEGVERKIEIKKEAKKALVNKFIKGKMRIIGFTDKLTSFAFADIATPRKQRLDPTKDASPRLCVELENIQSKSGKLNGISKITDVVSLKTIFHPGDVLFGKLRAYLRKYWLATDDGVCSTEIWAFEPNLEKITSEILFQIVQSDSFIYRASMSQGTHMPRSNWEVVSEYEVVLPSMAEQKEISKIFNCIESEISFLEKKLSILKDQKKYLLSNLITGAIRTPETLSAHPVKSYEK